MKPLYVIAYALCLPAIAWTNVTTPAIISDDMVLQQGKPIPIWGWAEEGEEITVKLGGQTRRVTAVNGTWEVTFDPLEAGGPLSMSIQGNDVRTIENILVGEVWLASGQSNMYFSVEKGLDADKHVAEADYPGIRLFTVARAASDEPLEDVEGTWEVCTPDEVEDFSAVAYHFGRAVHQETGYPVGLIHSSVGGSIICCWSSEENLRAHKDAEYFHENYEKRVVEYEEKLALYLADPEANKKPSDLEKRKPEVYFNGMIAPLIPYTLQGVIWYQGESDSWVANYYFEMFPNMIRDWRNKWESDLAFHFVQLAGYSGKEGVDNNYPYIRDAQLKTLSLPNTGMAVAIDVGEKHDIHPRDKQTVGERLALTALESVYGKTEISSGPLFTSAAFEGNEAVLEFDCVADGLRARGEELKGFQLADEEGKFLAAEARIDGERVVVWCDEIEKPAEVRYGWDGFPECNLYNSANLPASPFRTDEIPWSRYR